MRSLPWVWWLPVLFLVCTGGCGQQAKPTPSGVEEAPRPTGETKTADVAAADAAAPPNVPTEPAEAAADPDETGGVGRASGDAATGGKGGSSSSSTGGRFGSAEENETDTETNLTPLDPTPGGGSCPAQPEHGSECVLAVGTGCFYPLEKCICRIDPDGEHRWDCDVTDCPLSEPEHLSDCSAAQTRICSYDTTQCFCSDDGWYCQACPVEPPHYFDNFNHCFDEFCPYFPCFYGDGWVCECSCTWECTQR